MKSRPLSNELTTYGQWRHDLRRINSRPLRNEFTTFEQWTHDLWAMHLRLVSYEVTTYELWTNDLWAMNSRPLRNELVTFEEWTHDLWVMNSRPTSNELTTYDECFLLQRVLEVPPIVHMKKGVVLLHSLCVPAGAYVPEAPAVRGRKSAYLAFRKQGQQQKIKNNTERKFSPSDRST